MHTHGAIFRKTSVPNPGVAPPGGCVFLGQPFFWVGGLQNLGTALQNGATLVCQPKPEPAAALLLLIERTGATMVIAWPNTTLRLQADPSFASRDLRAVPQLTMPSGDPELRHGSLGMTETIGPHTGFAAGGAGRGRRPRSRELVSASAGLRCAVAVHGAQDRRSRIRVPTSPTATRARSASAGTP